MAIQDLTELSPNAERLAKQLGRFITSFDKSNALKERKAGKKFAPILGGRLLASGLKMIKACNNSSSLIRDLNSEEPYLVGAAFAKAFGQDKRKAVQAICILASKNNGQSPVDLDTLTEGWPMDGRIALALGIQKFCDSCGVEEQSMLRGLGMRARSLAAKSILTKRNVSTEDVEVSLHLIQRANADLGDIAQTRQLIALRAAKETSYHDSVEKLRIAERMAGGVSLPELTVDIEANASVLTALNEKMGKDTTIVTDPNLDELVKVTEDTILAGTQCVDKFSKFLSPKERAALFAKVFNTKEAFSLEANVPSFGQGAIEEFAGDYLAEATKSPEAFLKSFAAVETTHEVIVGSKNFTTVTSAVDQSQPTPDALLTAVKIVKDGSAKLQTKTSAMFATLLDQVHSQLDHNVEGLGLSRESLAIVAAKISDVVQKWGDIDLYTKACATFICEEEKTAFKKYAAVTEVASRYLGGLPLDGELTDPRYSSSLRRVAFMDRYGLKPESDFTNEDDRLGSEEKVLNYTQDEEGDAKLSDEIEDSFTR